MPFSVTRWPICPEHTFFGTNHYYFHLPVGPFYCSKFTTNSYGQSNVVRFPILGPKWSICPKQFFGENYWYHFHLTISPFHCAEFEKNPFSGSRVMRICNFWAYNGPIAQMRILLENMLMDLVSFIHAYLHAKNQTQTLIY